jgi:cardiolipin synthase
VRREIDEDTEGAWSGEELLFDGDAYFSRLLRDIEQAQATIDFETYIFKDDVTGKKICRALSEASARGVRVRVIVDGIGASGWFERNGPLLGKQNVEVRVYHPILFHNLWMRIKIDLGILAPPKSFERLRGSVLVSRFNRRDHRKLVLIDTRITYVGSVNVTDDHCASIVGSRAWRDTSVRFEDGPVLNARAAFENVWERCHDAEARPRWRDRLVLKRTRLAASRFLRFNHTSRLRKQTYRSLIRRIAKARHRVWVTNPYFAPSTSLLRALAKATKNGADVRILVPRNSDVFFMPWVATAYYAVVLKGGARIYEYLPRMLHAKTAVIDNWAIVGSSNFNRRSLVHDFEVDAMLAHETTRAHLVAAFHKDLEQSEEVTAARGGLTAFLGRLVSFLLKNWI